MNKFRFNGDQLAWIACNLGMVVRVVIFLALVVTFLFIPHEVLAQPSMGGSVGSMADVMKGIQLP